MTDLLREIGRKAEALCGEAYFVGGCVRDLLRGVASKDIDLAVTGSTHRLGRALVSEHGGHVFYLRQEDEVVRVLLPGLGDLQLDLSPLRGTLEEDLKARDLTINAMAAPASGGLDAGSQVVDLVGGKQDLQDRLIRFVSPHSPVSDPLRTMRAFRFRWKLGFELAEGTLDLIRQCIPLLSRVSGERIRDELFQVLSLDTAPDALGEILAAGTGPWLTDTREAPFNAAPPRVAEVLRRLSSARLTPTAQRSTPNASPHPHPHTPTPPGRSDQEHEPDQDQERLRDLLSTEPTPGRRRREVLLWAAALQALIPPVETGPACKQLALSNDEKQLITKALAAAPQAAELADRWPVPGRERYRLFKKAGSAGPEAVLLSPGAWDAAHEELLAEALDLHLHPRKPLLTGHEVMQLLKLKPGPELGRLMEALEEARADGLVRTPDEAARWLQEEHARAG